MELEIEIIRSDRKTVSIEIDASGNAKLRVPKNISRSEIERIIKSKQDWIKEKIKKQKEKTASQPSVKKLSNAELRELADRALDVLPSRVRYFASLMNVEYSRITVRNQKTRWGSCSSQKNLNFNCLLMLVPEEIRDYVIVHELAHLKEMNHSKKFWSEVEKVLPDYRERVQWLKTNGSRFIAMLPE
ncbi:MAG: M48 family metallopeptidase [Clostridia bacterium]|nr:M48 family metallopeptidase [Clostridia bacterium]